MNLKYAFRGELVDEAQLIAAAPKTVRAPLIAEPKHNGFAVVGYKPGVIAEAEKAHAREMDRWRNKSPESRAEMGLRDPGPWSAESWMRKHPPLRVAKARETPDGANALAELAKRQGWEFVRVVELITGMRK